MKQCPQCGEQFQSIGQHWRRSNNCQYPKLTNKQVDIIKGLLLGDGHLASHHNKNEKCHLSVNMITRKYLEYLDDIFGSLSTGVKEGPSARQRARENRESGFSPNAKAEDYHDVYRWRTCNHPKLDRFARWYKKIGKVWPKDIRLTPVTLKNFFVGDGRKCSNKQPYIEINISNEGENKDKVNSMFSNVDLPLPNSWDKHARDNGSISTSIRWTVKQSKELWKYMGPPLPGFSYKWPDNQIT